MPAENTLPLHITESRNRNHRESDVLLMKSSVQFRPFVVKTVLAWRIPGTRGAWWAAVYGVAQSWTRLKRLSSSSSSSEDGVLTRDAALSMRDPSPAALHP